MKSEGIVSLTLKRLVDKAIKLYNKYRSPEAIARLMRIDGDIVIVYFEGSFCETCGINDWVEDLRFIFEDLGAEAELINVEEPDDPFSTENWRIGYFKVRIR